MSDSEFQGRSVELDGARFVFVPPGEYEGKPYSGRVTINDGRVKAKVSYLSLASLLHLISEDAELRAFLNEQIDIERAARIAALQSQSGGF